jgi:hypothetical protein
MLGKRRRKNMYRRKNKIGIAIVNDEQYHKLFNLIAKQLYITIDVHGPIKRKYVPSATKRVVGSIKTLAFNIKIQNIKKIRNFPFTTA